MKDNVTKLTGKLEGFELVNIESKKKFAIGGKTYDLEKMSPKMAERLADDPKVNWFKRSESTAKIETKK